MSAREDAANGCLAWILGLPIMVGIIALDTILGAWALVALWDWFVVPTFGLHPLGFWVAAGLQLAYMALRGPVHTGVPQSDAGASKMFSWVFLNMIVRPFWLVGIGYVVHLMAVRP